MRSSLRLGGGAGFAGDRLDAPVLLVEHGALDYLVLECLAERTIALAQLRRRRDPNAGFDARLDERIESLLPVLARKRVRLVSNLGAANPEGAAARIAAIARRMCIPVKVAAVTGDDVLDALDLDAPALESGLPLSKYGPVVSANAYLGAEAILPALASGADIVITGRVADAALSLGPLMHELGWRWDDWEKLAQGLTVGHLLECSGQATGGNFGSAGEWAKVQNFVGLGYPIAEVSEDGTAVVTKAPGTGGRVNFDTLRQQLLYEVHNPHAYYSPDVVLDMGTLNFDDRGNDSVRITGAGGAKRPDTLKVVAGYHDGWMGTGMIGFSWPDAYLKCETSVNIIKGLMEERGWKPDEVNAEYIGYNSLLGANADPAQRDNLNECFIRMTIRTPDKRMADGFGRLFPWLGLSGPPYVGGFKGVQGAKELLGLWPTRVAREAIEPRVAIDVEAVA